MRISDWSSDVCSSDLAGNGRKRSRRPPMRRRILANRTRGTTTSASWNTTYGPWRTIRAPIPTNFTQSVVSDHCSISFDRSEEHTSELQSLMRISYAVFCLKKKKKRQHSHNDIASTIQTYDEQ